MNKRLISKGTAAAFAHDAARAGEPTQGLRDAVAAYWKNKAPVAQRTGHGDSTPTVGGSNPSRCATIEEVAWVLRVHNVGEDAARRSREYDNGRGSTGWLQTLAEARAITEQFDVRLAQVDRNPKGHDPAEGHGRNDESPVAATSGDAPEGS